MSGERKEIDLIFRAALEGGKTLESVTKSISEIEVALEAQAAAAKRGESAIDDLKGTLESLKRVQDDLKNQASLIADFKALAEQIVKSEEKVTKAAQAHADYTAKLEKAGTATEAQSNKLIKLANASERSQAVLAQQRDSYSTLSDKLSKAGIATDALSGAQTRIRESAAQAAISLVKVNEAIRTYSSDAAKAKKEGQALVDEKVFQQKLEDAAKLNKAGQYVLFWTNALREADIAEGQLKANEALRKAADEAIAATRGYKTLGTAMKGLKEASGGVREAVQGILDPSAKVTSTLSGVEQTVGKVTSAVSAIKGPVGDYRGQVQQLAAAQKAITDQAGIVDAFSRQVAAVRQSRAEYVTARAAVLQYAEALRTSSGNSDQLQASLRNAQSAFSAAQKNLSAQIATANGLRDAMRGAGLSTSNLAATQERLTSAARDSTAAMQGLRDAHAKHGDAVKQSTQAYDLFNSSGRTTLSMTQRIRGQVLSMVAAYVSLYAAINGAKGVVEAFNTKQSVSNQLGISVGNDAKKIAEEWKYLEAQADRLGISLEVLANGYAKFLASSVGTGVSKQNVRFIFETFTEVGRVAGVTRDDMDGIFKALGQILSKGKIQSEELRGQLADRLFGVFGTAKEALKGLFPDFDKALKEGKVTSNYLLQISEAYKKLVAGQLPAATKTLQASQERLNTEIFKFKTLVAEQGFASEYANLVQTLTTFFRSSDGKEFAKGLSSAFGFIAQGLKFIIENLESIKIALQLAFALYAQKEIIALGARALKAAKDFNDLRKSLDEVDGARGKLMGGFLLLNAFFVGWKVGELLFEQIVYVRKFFVYLISGATDAFLRVKFAAESLFVDALPNIFENGLAKTDDKITGFLRSTLAAFALAARAMGKVGLAEAIEKSIQAITVGTGKAGGAAKKLHDQLARDLAQLRRDTALALKEAESGNYGKPVAPAVVRSAGATAPDGTKGKGSAAVDEEAAKKRITTRKQLEKDLEAIEVLIAKRETDTLGDRLHAIDVTYGELEARIREFGGNVSAAMLKSLDLSKSALGAQVIEKFEKELTTAKTGIEKRLRAIDVKIGKSDTTNAEARLKALRDKYEEYYTEIEKFRKTLSDNGKSTVPADVFKSELDDRLKILASLEQMRAYEATVNALLADRDQQLELINSKVKAKVLTERQGQEQALDLVNKTQPGIEKATEAALAFVTVLRDAAAAAGQSTVEFDKMLSKLITAKESSKGLRTEFLSVAQVNEMLSQGATTAFQTMAGAIGDAARGLKSWKDAIGDTARAFAKFAADFLMQIGQMIIKQQILKLLESSGGSGGNFITSAISALVSQHHAGGVVGSGGTSRVAPVAWFANAPRYHGGGVPGLAPDEYAAILKKNEEVLTQGDPRNVLNGGKSGGASPSRPQDIKVINMIDSGSVVSEGLATREGEQSFFNFIRANRTGLKQILA